MSQNPLKRSLGRIINFSGLIIFKQFLSRDALTRALSADLVSIFFSIASFPSATLRASSLSRASFSALAYFKALISLCMGVSSTCVIGEASSSSPSLFS